MTHPHTKEKLWTKSLHKSQEPIRPAFTATCIPPVSVALKQQVLEEYFYSPLDGMLVHHKVTFSIKFADTHLYTLLERGTVRIKCLAQEHNTVSPARPQTQTTWSRDDCNNHEATTLPTVNIHACDQLLVTCHKYKYKCTSVHVLRIEWSIRSG